VAPARLKSAQKWDSPQTVRRRKRAKETAPTRKVPPFDGTFLLSLTQSPELMSFAPPAGILLLLARLLLAATLLLLAGLLTRALVLLTRFPGRLAGFLIWIVHSGSPFE